jgi:hypothetical protein
MGVPDRLIISPVVCAFDHRSDLSSSDKFLLQETVKIKNRAQIVLRSYINNNYSIATKK